MSRAYYNEIDPAAAHLLRCLINDGVIAPGDVDERSIKDVEPSDLKGYTQAHFFAGGGLWAVAARLAGWPDDRPLWTGSCPCQPFSVAGKGKGTSDERHLWPVFFSLIRACRPPVVMGEQVAGAAGYGWFDGVAADLEGEGYSARAVDIPACAVNAPHIRQRLYWCAVADADEPRLERRLSAAERAAEQPSGPDGVADADSGRQPQLSELDGHAPQPRQQTSRRNDTSGRHSFWSDHIWLTGADGKARRAQPGVRLLVDGFPNRVAALRIAGNAIVPSLAAEVIRALMDVYDPHAEFDAVFGPPEAWK